MKTLLKEPLLHFLLIGAVFFALYAMVNPGAEDKNTITIDESDLEEIVSKFEMQWKRNPTEEELTDILEKRIHEEIFYQEALNLNLDHNDEIIKRRLAQKMQFLSNDLANLLNPTDEELKAFYTENSSKYTEEPRFSFYQVYFDTQQGFGERETPEGVLAKNPNASLDEMMQFGDEISLPKYVEESSTFQVARQFGDDFAAGLQTAETGKWFGPVQSGFGVHLVFIAEKVPGRTLSFAEAKEKVKEDFSYQMQSEINDAVYQEFRKKYDVEIDVNSDLYSSEFINQLKASLAK